MEASRTRVDDDYTEIIRRLPISQRLAYGIGHILNDICASMWFTYLLVYFHLVLQFDSTLSGVILLVGQVADALATPFVGIQSDRDDGYWLCKYGRRKTWHLLGTICVIGSFPFIFSPCVNCETSHQWAQMIYYSAFVIIFQFGWASVQISHLSLIPDLTPSEHERTELTAIRYSSTVCSNILVYVITWSVFHVANTSEGVQVGPNDTGKFLHIVLIGMLVGTISSVLFHIFVRESQSQGIGHGRTAGNRKTASHLVKDLNLYQVAAVYMATRLFANLSQVYIPLYLHESLNMSAESLAIVPLVMFIASFVMSLIIKPLNEKCGRKIAYLIGGGIGIGSCIWIRLGSGVNYTTYEIYGVASLLGSSSSIMLVTSLGITADLIGPNTHSGAFVYGAMSFFDKLSNGIAVTIIQSMKCLSPCPDYYRDILTYVCGGAVVFGLLALATLTPFHIVTKVEDEEPLNSEPDEYLQGTGSSSAANASIQRNAQPSLIS